VFEDPGQAVDGFLLEEDQLSGTNLTGSKPVNYDLGASGKDVQILVAAGVKVRRRWTMHTEDTAARGWLIGKTDVREHGLGVLRESGGELGDGEESALAGHDDCCS
jgi:hypothetical protein